jgi:GxxExxY protein
MGDGFRADNVVNRQVILEIKAVATIIPAHEVQPQTYLRMSGIKIGRLTNSNAPRLIGGLRRVVVSPPEVQAKQLLWPLCLSIFLP